MQPWDPEHGVDRELAVRLVGAIWSDLGSEPVYVGSGWDVDVWRFGAYAVRFPRRAFGIACLENELRVLPAIADRVVVPVPRPLRIGEPAFGYPSRFYVHAFLAGAPLIRTPCELAVLAAPLGAFLRELHAIDVPLHDDPRGGIPQVAARALARLELVPDDVADRARVILTAPPSGEPPRTVIHGDLHAANLLVDARGLCGVIDWGDAARGDPAVDLAVAWSALPPDARPAFRAAYGPIDPDTWARARIHAVSRHCFALLAWGRDRGDAAIVRWATAALARALAE